MRRSQRDLVVIGGGPAGLATAMAARREGMRVMVVDCALPPVDKPCGEGLMPDGREALRAIGFAVDQLESFAFRGIRFVEGGTSVEADFPQGCALGIRRPVLHACMVEQAADAGIEMRWGSTVTGISPWGVQVDGGIVRCRWIAGADGSQSRVRHWSGLDAAVFERRRYGFRRHYRIPPWSDYMELYWADACQVYVTPVTPDRVCVASISNDPALRLEQALAQLPALAARLSRGEPEGDLRGAISATRRLHLVCGRRVALVGDASGSVDAITGEGMCVAFQQAAVLARCLAGDSLAGYEVEHRRIMRRPGWIAEGMLQLGAHPHIRRLGIKLMSARPSVFAGMLAVHVGGTH